MELDNISLDFDQSKIELENLFNKFVFIEHDIEKIESISKIHSLLLKIKDEIQLIQIIE